jgi:hypothetical protein
MPCHHIFQSYLLDYIENAKLADADREAPLFRTAYRCSGTLTGSAHESIRCLAHAAVTRATPAF